MQQSTPTRLRSACDVCHQSKVKCSGGSPCHGCQRIGIACNYSSSNQNGRPRGVRNKKTLQRMQAAAANAARENESKKLMQPTPPGNAGMSDPTIEPLVELGTSTGDLEEMNIGMVSGLLFCSIFLQKADSLAFSLASPTTFLNTTSPI